MWFQYPKAMSNIQIIKALALVLFLITFQNLNGQSATSRLHVNVEENSLVYFTLDIQKGQTLYSICKKYRVDIGDALVLNDLSDLAQISVGQKIRLPLNKQYFFSTNQEPNLSPVYYTVQPKETLFRVSKVYFSQDVKDMIERNQLTGFSLSIDQELIVGYFKLGSVPTKSLASSSLIVPEAKVSTPKETTKEIETTSLEKVKAKEISPATIEVEISASDEVEVNQIQNAKEPVVRPDQIQKKSKSIKILPKTHKKKEIVLETSEPRRASKTNNTSEVEDTISNIETTEVGDSEAKLESVVKETIVTDIVEEMDELPVEPTMAHVSKKGTAYWDKNGTDYENLMVLHKTAAVNSLIKLTNPINKLSTFARVVGQIPPNAFKKNIELVMSPAVAKKIGIRDSKFQVEMVYQVAK